MNEFKAKMKQKPALGSCKLSLSMNTNVSMFMMHLDAKLLFIMQTLEFNRDPKLMLNITLHMP